MAEMIVYLIINTVSGKAYKGLYKQYNEMISKIDLNYDFESEIIIHDKEDKFCDGAACEISFLEE